MANISHELIEKAVNILKEAGAGEIYLFGSITSGKWNKDSDVDIAVSGLPPEIFFKTMSKVRRLLRCPIDLIDLDEPTPFTRYLQEEGILQRVG